MARSEAKRQKKIAKHKAKRNQKRREIACAPQMRMADQVGCLQAGPVADCLCNADLEFNGIGHVFIGRHAPAGEFGVGVFLIDLYCLGVKDCFGRLATPSRYSAMRKQFEAKGVRRLDPPSACRLVNDAVEYASSLGFRPHADFRRVQPILNGIDPAEARVVFEMGKDGKPFFVSGPFDSAEKSRRIVAQLHKHCGPGGYDFMTHHLSVIESADGGILAMR